MKEVEGEPSKSEGAIDTAIRLLKKLPNAKRGKEKTLSDRIHKGYQDAGLSTVDVKQTIKDIRQDMDEFRQQSSSGVVIPLGKVYDTINKRVGTKLL